MRIIQVVHSFYPAVGGIEQHTYHLAKALARLGHEVVVHTSGKGEETVHGIRIRRHWAWQLPFFSSVNFSPGLILALLGERADVFASHGYGSTMPYWTAMVAWLKGKPFTFTLHGYPKLKGWEGIFQWYYKTFVAPVFLRIARKIIVVSKATQKEIAKEADGRKIVYIPNGVGREFFQGKGERSNTIAYIGRFDRYKRVEMLIDAFAEVKKEFPKLELALVGKDEGVRKELEERAKQAGVALIFGEAMPAEMPRLYGQLKAVVLPSAYEGFSLVWLEAMASGTAMFSTPVGEAPELFTQAYGKQAERFLFTDNATLVERLRDYLKKEREYAKLLARARQMVKQKYSWEAVAKETEKAYRSIQK